VATVARRLWSAVGWALRGEGESAGGQLQ
jgi:hypothetical protein